MSRAVGGQSGDSTREAGPGGSPRAGSAWAAVWGPVFKKEKNQTGYGHEPNPNQSEFLGHIPAWNWDVLEKQKHLVNSR